LSDASATERAVLTAEPEFVVHLAAISFVAHSNAEDFYRVNVIGTLNLLRAVGRLKRIPKRVIVASSANVYGAPDIEVLDESLCPAPVSHYSCIKLAMEHMVRTWFDRLPIVITRPFNYTGPGQAEHFLVPKIVNHFKRKAPFVELGNLHVSRDYSDVEDVVAAYVALMECEAEPQVVNICSGRAVALLDIVAMMNEIAGYKIEVRVNPEFVRANEVPMLVGSPARLRNVVTLPVARPFHETLRNMYEAKDN
jgi:nucleoside-diphosphate-sugar epimerase